MKPGAEDDERADGDVGAAARVAGTDDGVAIGADPDVATGAAARSRLVCTEGTLPSCGCAPVSAVAVSMVGATTSERVLSGSVHVVRRTSRGMRRSSPARAPRRATAPGRGNGCHAIDSSTSTVSSLDRGGSDSARGIADSARASSTTVDALTAPGPPGVAPARTVLPGALAGRDGSASREMTTSAAGRVAPT